MPKSLTQGTISQEEINDLLSGKTKYPKMKPVEKTPMMKEMDEWFQNATWQEILALRDA